MIVSKPRLRARGRAARPLRRTGYAVSIAVNFILIWVVTNLVSWGILPFLTDEFAQVETLAVSGLVVGIVLYGIYLMFDPPWMRILGDAINSSIAFVVGLRTLQVFPFEFEGGFWTGATRAILIFLVAVTAIATLVSIGKLLFGRTAEADLINRST